jgi:hypothetical protein
VPTAEPPRLVATAHLDEGSSVRRLLLIPIACLLVAGTAGHGDRHRNPARGARSVLRAPLHPS